MAKLITLPGVKAQEVEKREPSSLDEAKDYISFLENTLSYKSSWIESFEKENSELIRQNQLYVHRINSLKDFISKLGYEPF